MEQVPYNQQCVECTKEPGMGGACSQRCHKCGTPSQNESPDTRNGKNISPTRFVKHVPDRAKHESTGHRCQNGYSVTKAKMGERSSPTVPQKKIDVVRRFLTPREALTGLKHCGRAVILEAEKQCRTYYLTVRIGEGPK